MKTMYAYSSWAKNNLWSARVLVILGHLLLMFLAWIAGTLLLELGWSIPVYLLYGSLISTSHRITEVV